MTVLACTVRPWAKLPFERALRGIVTAGYDAVALPVHGVTALITADTTVARARKVAAVIDDHGLDLVILSHAADLSRDDAAALSTLRRQLDHCARLGVSTLVDMGCPELTDGDRYLRLMAAAAPYAADHGITIAVKPHGGLTRTAADTLTVVERVGHESFRACWDPGNLVHYGGEPPGRGLADLAPYIAAVGARDHPPRSGHRVVAGGMPPPITPGDGIVDFVELYRTLGAHGFTGPSAVESVTKLGTGAELDSEAARARQNLQDAVAGRIPQRCALAIPTRQSCSLVARAAGEDPIGTARNFDRYLMLELPLPWPPGMGTPVWETARTPAPLRAALRAATRRTEERGLTMKTFAAAPDPQYSVAGLMRIILFDRTGSAAAEFARQEYHVPLSGAPHLIDALFPEDAAGEISAPAEFEPHRVQDTHRDLVVCTHAAVDACCGTYGYPLYRQLRDAHGGTGVARVWRCSSFGGHRFAPTLIDFPEGRWWGNLTPDRLAQLVDRTGHPTDLMDLYRGWSYLSHPVEQVLERELFRHYGWGWRHHQLVVTPTSGQCYDIAVHDPRTGTTRHHTADVHALTPREVLVGCDRTVGEAPAYAARLVCG